MSLHDHDRIKSRLQSIADPTGFLTNLFAHAPVAFAVWTADGRPLLTNQAFVELFGSEPPPEYNVLEDDLVKESGMLPTFQRAFAGETVHVPTSWYDPRDLKSVSVTEGRRVAISMTLFPLFDRDGRVEYVAATYKDQTEIMLALDSKAHTAAVMEAALDAIVLMNHEGEIVEFNPAAELTFGYARDEVLGKPLADVLIPEPLREQHTRGLQRYLASGDARVLGTRVELQASRKDGTVFPAEIAVVRIRTQGAPLFTGYIRDITDRRRAAEAEVHRRAKEAAELANAELETFSYSVAHDLREPLRGMSGFATVLREDYGDALDATARSHLDRISASAQRMAAIIDALLALARLTRTPVLRETVDLTAMARAVAEQLRRAEPARAVDVVVTEGLSVDADPQLLRALLESLLGNAWKFTRRRTAARVELGHEEAGNARVFFVRDNGAGFDMTLVDRLFAPFRRLHARDEFDGAGLGLASAQRIVRRHGGRIWAVGGIDEGSTFYFTLSGA
ncbi:MAG: PAS domain S-box protein [Labilithrix sp.]|nr:PAS domain S-box protein [Labilithrix sp.]